MTWQPSPTGLEGMPAFNTSLGCSPSQASYVWLNNTISRDIPLPGDGGHSVDVHGLGVGTILVAAASADQTNISYTVTVRSDSDKVLRDMRDRWPVLPTDESRVVFSTPNYLGAGACVRYDIVLRVPRGVRKLHVQAHAKAHIKLAEGSDALKDLDDLFVTMYSLDKDNILQTTEDVKSKRIAFQVTRGYVVGAVSIDSRTAVTTQSGDAIVNIQAYPHTTDTNLDGPAELSTLTGAGRTDVTYHAPVPRRPILSEHRVQNGGDIYLTYKDARFNGAVDVDAKSYSMRNIQSEGAIRYVGDRAGGDKLEVHTGGWARVYF